MPSLADVANDIKALLDDIKSNTLATKNNTAQTAANVMILNSTSQAGFSNLANGIAVEIALQHQTNDLLNINNEQNEVIICWLKNVANVLCNIKNNTDKSVALETEIKTTIVHLDKISELLNSEQAMEVLKHNELQKQIEKCCPPLVIEPKPCFDDCKLPKFSDYKPIDTKWTPIKFDDTRK